MGLTLFADMVSSDPEPIDKRTDAIVVLTGGSERIATGLSLLADNNANALFITGVGDAVIADDLIPADQPGRGLFIDRVTVGYDAQDTPGNAIETAAWVENTGALSIRLVTAAYHMPRSLREFQHTMPHIIIVAHPVFPEQVKRDWWRYPGTTSLLATEYTKFLFSTLRLWTISVMENSQLNIR